MPAFPLRASRRRRPRCRFRRPLVRRFTVARDQQYRNLDAGTRRSVSQATDGRAEPAIDTGGNSVVRWKTRILAKNPAGRRGRRSFGLQAGVNGAIPSKGPDLDVAERHPPRMRLQPDEPRDGIRTRQATIRVGASEPGTKVKS